MAENYARTVFSKRCNTGRSPTSNSMCAPGSTVSPPTLPAINCLSVSSYLFIHHSAAALHHSCRYALEPGPNRVYGGGADSASLDQGHVTIDSLPLVSSLLEIEKDENVLTRVTRWECEGGQVPSGWSLSRRSSLVAPAMEVTDGNQKGKRLGTHTLRIPAVPSNLPGAETAQVVSLNHRGGIYASTHRS